MSKREIWFARNEEAEALEHEGRFDEALARYQENAREGCDIPFTHERIASIQRKLGRMKEAVTAYDRAIELEKRRGPSDRLVRLQEKRTVAADLASRPATSIPRPARRERSAHPRAAGSIEKEAKGCLGKAAVVMIMMMSTIAATLISVLR
jgi:tetratricopeptide (TPR) repeat protein